ncbi:hypothetical protein NP493_892g02016 [Ridgeia piscesae]|uniref:Uncharacterized protein n=1 Tax=Ridgeia piscesae TaxID=27915 RepID=A0AAD9KKP4_RIDPI|nr:hypothetical protein NP493_892g02016 [Ridgeia piscesae]
MPTLVSTVWALLSIVVAGVCSFSFLQPFWLVRQRPAAISLGMYGYCLWDSRFQVPTQVCGIYGGYFSVSHLPSNSWQAACVLYGGGCAFLCFGALLAVLTLCFQRQLDSKIAVFNGYIQTMGGVPVCQGSKVTLRRHNSVA